MDKKKKETILTLLALVVLTLVIIGISYAAFNYIRQGQRENTIQTGNLTFVYDESNKSGNGISIDNATPTTDEEGKASIKQGEVFEFNISASTKGAPIYYEIYTIKQSDSTLPERVVKTYLTELQGTEEVEVLDTLNNQAINFYNKLGISQVPNQGNGRTLYQEMIPEGQNNYSKTFRYRMWIREDATETNERGVWKYANKSFTIKVNVYASNHSIEEPIKPEQEPNEPVLVQGYIPVIYNEEQKTWVKADTGTNWYNYSNQEWANAVTVKASGTKTREEYMSAEAGTPVSMNDINTMWVWIPRYEYMYTNLGENYAGGTKEQPGEIKVNFIEGTGTIPSDSTNYKVHPAFTFGSDELDGLWYAKFETGGSLTSDCTNTSCNVSTIAIKPNETSFKFKRISNFFYMARSMQLNSANSFGFSKTDSDLHLSKNSEWGAVAYLSQSKYGKYGNPDYEGAEKEVRINNCRIGDDSNPTVKTGIGASSRAAVSNSSVCTTNTYETINGQAASTTGNITGVYDMNGGSWEYVMGNSNKVIGDSGFTTLPEEKYYDLYISTDLSTACNSGICYGHAASETKNWYQDYYYGLLSGSYNQWIIRGGYYESEQTGGVFSTYIHSGGTHRFQSARFILVPLI